MKPEIKMKGTLLPLFLVGMASSLIFTILFAALFRLHDEKIWLMLEYICGLILYHFFMRFFLGSFLSIAVKGPLDYSGKWFREKAFEKQLYRKIGVKKWKARMPTFDAALFSVKNSSPEILIQQVCHAEVVHVTTFFFCYLSVLLSLFAEDRAMFLVISITIAILSSLLELLLIIVQRYNRPRLIRLMEKHR